MGTGWRRDLGSLLPLAALLALLAGIAWLSTHPDSPLVARLARAPGIGRLVERLRPSETRPTPAAPTGEGVEVFWVGEEERPAAVPGPGAPPGPPPHSTPSTPPAPPRPVLAERWARPGSELRAAGDPAAPEVDRLVGWTLLPVLAARAGWSEVWLGGRALWLPEAAFSAADERPLGSAPEPPRPLPGRPADPARLDAARRLLGAAARSGRLGPYALLTDLAPGTLPAGLETVASALEAAYRERSGLAPAGEPLETVVLFARRADYRRFQAAEERLAGLPATGHAARGLVALAAEADGEETEPPVAVPAGELAATLAHELVHLLNRRALGPALPPWLDEGLAEDLAWRARDADGRSLPDPDGWEAGHEIRLEGSTLRLSGALAALETLARARAAGTAPSIEALLAAEWEAFVAPERATLHYAASLWLVRCLFDAEGGALAPGFRAYLRDVARGEPAGGAALAAAVGRPLPVVDASCGVFVNARREVARQALPTPPETPTRRRPLWPG